MKLIVCIKQVPGTTKVEVDPETGVLKRDGVESKLNPYDLFALEMAFELTEAYGGQVSTLTMGPPQVRSSLLETLYMGADQAVLLADGKFAGADVAATSYVLKKGVEKIADYDLIICGKQTTDGDTAQVGPEMAELLGIEHVTNVYEIVDVKDGYITLRFHLDDKLQTQRMKLPCLISIDKDANTPRLPSFKRKLEVKENQIITYSAEDLQAEESRCGLKGSPTKVERIFPPEKNEDRSVLYGSGEALAEALGRLLAERKYI